MNAIAIMILAASLGPVPSGEAFLNQLQPRDSILVADQVEYGFELSGVAPGTILALPDYSPASNDTLTLVRGWQLDTVRAGRLRGKKSDGPLTIRGSVVFAPFEEGKYRLPEIYVQRNIAGVIDTLMFSAKEMDVKTMPVDTAEFRIHDIKGQMVYPVTFAEVLPYLGGVLVLAGLTVLAVWLIKKKRKEKEALARTDPPHIVALRELDRYRSEKFWSPDRQKAFYSGVTDALKNYIDARFGVDAPEMTTAELFDALKKENTLSNELYSEAKDLFERADFVKFAKYVASDKDNANALPVAVRFVTETYQAEIEEESGNVL